MKTFDGKLQLQYSTYRDFIRAMDESDILITFFDGSTDVELLTNKVDILETFFNRKFIKKYNRETIVTLFNPGAILETTIGEIFFWSTPGRKKRLYGILGLNSPDEKVEDLYNSRKTSNNEVEQNEIETDDKKIVAIGVYDGDKMSNLEYIEVTKKEVKKAIEFLNTKIREYYTVNLQDEIRITVDYNLDKSIEESQWLTIDELFAKGIAS